MKRFFDVMMVCIFYVGYAQCQQHATDLIIFSYDRPLQLYALLESVHQYIKGVSKITVIYRISSHEFEGGYEQVKSHFENVDYLKQTAQAPADFKELILRAVSDSLNPYILFAVDDNVVTEPVDLNECIKYIEMYQAYAFYFRLGLNLDYCYAMDRMQEIPHLMQVESGVYGWCFMHAQYDWAYPHTVDFTLYRKADIYSFLHEANYYSPNSLEALWASNVHHIMHRYGLCYAHSKIINMPLNRVQHECFNRHMDFMSTLELLEIFNQGYKIDLQPLYSIDNKSAHMHYEPTFIVR